MEQKKPEQELWERIMELKAEIQDLPTQERTDIETSAELRETVLSCLVAERVLRTSDPLLKFFQLRAEKMKEDFLSRRRTLGTALEDAERHLEHLNRPIIDQAVKEWRRKLADLPKIERDNIQRSYDARRGAQLIRMVSNEDEVARARALLMEAINGVSTMARRPREEVDALIEKTQAAIAGFCFLPKQKIVDETDFERVQFIEKGLPA